MTTHSCVPLRTAHTRRLFSLRSTRRTGGLTGRAQAGLPSSSRLPLTGDACPSRFVTRVTACGEGVAHVLLDCDSTVLRTFSRDEPPLQRAVEGREVAPAPKHSCDWPPLLGNSILGLLSQ